MPVGLGGTTGVGAEVGPRGAAGAAGVSLVVHPGGTCGVDAADRIRSQRGSPSAP